MSEPVRVRTYSGHRADERPLAIELEGTFQPVDVLEQWRTPEAECFRVRLPDGRHLRLDRGDGVWRLQTDSRR